jgi:hypothetical protein
MEWTERTRYQASWGVWYVQIEYSTGQIVEFKFDHEPTVDEIQPIAQKVWESMQPAETTFILEAEDETEI